ncbi:MAG: ATP-binding protein [Clostridia bacterium]|nr:ATP-binding protein [Clostridia bacterium]
MQMVVERKGYLKQLSRWRDERVIKVITGMRRSGKSTLMSMYKDSLIANGVLNERIVYVNFEDISNEDLLDHRSLYEFVCSRLAEDKTTYVFLDEIQMVSSFQKAVDSLFLKENVDLYITGSNAYLLSGELATLLSGRYVEINILPLSFAEYCGMIKAESRDEAFLRYMRWGGLPYVARISDDDEKTDLYLEGIYNTILIKDIEDRQKRRDGNPDSRKVTDITLLGNIARFLANSVGSPVSVKSISDYLISSGRKISPNTVSDYLSALTEPYIFYPVERFDISGKQLLKQSPKYYISDLGLRRHMLRRQNYDLGYSLENVVYLELLRRGYRVNVGKIGAGEVDFIAVKNDVCSYFQVTASMLEETTFEREMVPLRTIRDNYPKTVLTLDSFSSGNYNGILVKNVIEWLLNDEN